jgi:hypothetical protein
MRQFVCRWYWWLPALILAAGVGYVSYRAMHPPWEGTAAWEKYHQLRVGMSLSEADAILGKRPGRADELAGAEWGTELTWRRGEDRVVAHLGRFREVDQKRAVIRGHWFADPPLNESAWWRLRDWLGW